MEKKKVDYSKDIQITNPETNETFPARLLVNDPEFGVIVGFTNNDGKSGFTVNIMLTMNQYRKYVDFWRFLMFQKLKRDQL